MSIDKKFQSTMTNKFIDFSISRLKKLLLMNEFLDNDDIVMIGRADFIPNKKLVAKLKYCEIKSEYKNKLLL